MARPPRLIPENAWPASADPAAGARLLERFAERGPAEAAFAEGSGRSMLMSLGANSAFLADLALREAETTQALFTLGPDALLRRELQAIADLPPTLPQKELAAALRQAKRRVSLIAALADISAVWGLQPVTHALSDLAQAALRASVAHLLRAGHDRGELCLPDPSQPEIGSGFTVLAMGKLGARELNYSSDIDLVLLHDPEAGVYRGDQCAAWFSRLSRNLVTLMEARDANGYVFRTDLRLRPDPAATPPSISIHAAIIYYESMGQNWERAAMLKARPIAGDLAMGAGFLDAIRPFVWRRHLDFAAIGDIHAMKRRIDAHRHTAIAKGEAAARLLGFNVKLGQGGIREIEFLTQTLQLVWGGRDPALRDPRTLVALLLLVRAGHVSRKAARELAAAYRFLRRVEHRLQMVADRQTHELPDSLARLEEFALFMGFDSADGFAQRLLRELGHVSRHWAEVFSTVPEGQGPLAEAPAPLDFADLEALTGTLARLRQMGFAAPERIAETVAGWQAGRVRALRSHRARELLGLVLPPLLTALARQREPDLAFFRLATFLENLPAGVQILSLFQRNIGLEALVADVLGAAPNLAEHLARSPSALDGLLGRDEHTPARQLIRARLADARLLEEAIAAIRAVVRERDFAISVATLQGRLNADQAGLQRADLADAALSSLLPLVLADFATRYGTVKGGAMVVVALGKAGGRETMAGSDLDLMLIYDHPARVTASEGPEGTRSLPASQWFIRAVHAFVAALTAPDAEGPMYAVDMRLRPSGNKGPVAVSLPAFLAYHDRDAWTWERMALTRARVVAGPARLASRVEAAIRRAIVSGDPAQITPDAVSMRARLLREHPASGPWDVKHRKGGQFEVEFIVQTLQLRHGPVDPTLRVAVAGLAAAGHLDAMDAALLTHADRVWRGVQGMLRLSEGKPGMAEPGPTSAMLLLRMAHDLGLAAVDLAALRATLDIVAADIRHAFIRLLGDPET